MNNVVLTMGAACIVLATVGTGGKVLGVELPVIQKQRGWRLGAPAGIGCAFLAGAHPTRAHPGSAQASESPEVTPYRQAVVTTCTNFGASKGNALASVTYRNESLAEAYASRSSSGAPQWEVDGWVTSHACIATGEMDVVSGTIPRLTGHAAQSLPQYLAEHPDNYAHLRQI